MPNGQYKFLFQDGLELKKYDVNSLSWSVVGTPPASKDLFISEGMNDLSAIDDEALRQLNSDYPELLCWVDNNEVETIQVKLTAIPTPKLIIPLHDIDIKGELQNLILNISETPVYSDDNIIPIMTSYNSPEGIVSVSGIYRSEGWHAFDRDINSYWRELSSSNPWISYEFSQPKIINKYTIRVNQSASLTPSAWRFEGSNDGINWVILDVQSNQRNWQSFEKRTYVFKNNVPYKKYRLFITGDNDIYSDFHIAISEIEMMEYLPVGTIKVIVSSDGGITWKTFKEDVWQLVDISNLDDVKNNGMSPSELNAITYSQWQQFSSNNKIRLAYYLDQNYANGAIKINFLRSIEKVSTQVPILNSIIINYNELDKKYSGLMFMDTSQQYYSTSFGEILKYLDFGTMISGQTSLDVKVYLTNTLPFDVKNIRIYPEHNIDGLTVELSKTNLPFIAESELFYDQVLGFDEVIEFYVRLTTDKNKVGGGTFDIKVKADAV